jgi:NADH-quinone oxidoreductase subunit C
LSSPEGGPGTEEVTDEVTEEVVEVDELREGVVSALGDELGEALVATHVDPGREVWARVALDAWVTAGSFARDELRCPFFDFLSAIDWMPSPYGRDMDSQEDLIVHGGPERASGASGSAAPDEQTTGYAGGATRFQLLARVASPTRGHGLVLKADLADDAGALIAPTWVPVYAGAEWHEREAWEMFGITFTGHPDLRHLYLPGEFEGHPLRKDYPLLSRRVKPWPGIVDVEPMPGEEEGDGEDVEADGGDEA